MGAQICALNTHFGVKLDKKIFTLSDMTGRHECRWSWNISHPSASVQWSPMTKYNFLWIFNHIILSVLRNIFKFVTFYPLYGPYYNPLDNRFNMKCNGNILKMVTQKVPWNNFCKYTNFNFWLFSGQKIMVRGDPSYKNTKPCYLLTLLCFLTKSSYILSWVTIVHWLMGVMCFMTICNHAYLSCQRG